MMHISFWWEHNFFIPPPEVPESSSESGNDEDYCEIDNSNGWYTTWNTTNELS